MLVTAESRLRDALTREDVEYGRRIQQELHRRPELSGREVETASRVADELSRAGARVVLPQVGGSRMSREAADAEGEPGAWQGVLARFGSDASESAGGVLIRCELDALPIAERADVAYRSEVSGVAHLCGHDGHMATLLTLARVLGRFPSPGRPPIWLLFQPAEETGEGARAVLSDSRWPSAEIERAYALHNLPGFARGTVVLRAGTMCCASAGVEVELVGRAAHAAQPETGNSPARSLAALIEGLEQRDDRPGTEFATVVGAELGARAFGTAPDAARLFVTLRSATDRGLAAQIERLRTVVDRLARRDGLRAAVSTSDEFAATVNDEEEVARVRRVAAALAGPAEREPWIDLGEPFRWSEDFGLLLGTSAGALLGLGAGRNTAALHDPEYVFPPELVGIGARLLLGVLDDLCS